MTANQFRSLLYRAARLMGDVNAVQRGPSAIGKRIVRKTVMREVNSAINKALR